MQLNIFSKYYLWSRQRNIRKYNSMNCLYDILFFFLTVYSKEQGRPPEWRPPPTRASCPCFILCNATDKTNNVYFIQSTAKRGQYSTVRYKDFGQICYMSCGHAFLGWQKMFKENILRQAFSYIFEHFCGCLPLNENYREYKNRESYAYLKNIMVLYWRPPPIIKKSYK